MIDRLLESVHPGDNLTTFGDLVGASDVIAFPEASQVQVNVQMQHTPELPRRSLKLNTRGKAGF